MRTASLPWYDLPEVRHAHDELWSAVAERLVRAGLRDVPETLDRSRSYDADWHEPGLLLGQACGYDTVLDQPPPVRVIAAPHFDFEGCDHHTYRSFVVVPERVAATSLLDLRGRRCAINSPSSHSGMNGLRALVSSLHIGGRFFSEVHVSGAHELSLQMLRDDVADVAAIDCVTWGLLRRHRPVALAGMRIVGRTAPAPAPPYVTGLATAPADVKHLRASLGAAIESLQPRVRQTLGLRGLSAVDVGAYEPIAALARQAETAGYRELGGQRVAAPSTGCAAPYAPAPAKNLYDAQRG
ncbi:MAG: PhnD/SsuA/transferrin family substrate-binding protein [Myxococcota bacterium]